MAKIYPLLFALVLVLAGGTYWFLTGSVDKKGAASTERMVEDQAEAKTEGNVDEAVSSGEKTVNTAKNQISLVISAPADGSVTSSSDIKVIGVTTPDSDIFVNDEDSTADSNGNFSVPYRLDTGDNYILVVATDSEGQVAEVELNVIYEPEGN